MPKVTYLMEALKAAVVDYPELCLSFLGTSFPVGLREGRCVVLGNRQRKPRNEEGSGGANQAGRIESADEPFMR